MGTKVAAAVLCVTVALAGCGGGGGEGPSTGATPAGSPEAGGRAVQVGAMNTTQAHYESVVEMLRGKVPGLEVIELGTGQLEVRIRGMTQSLQETGQEPLVVVDGVPSSRPAGEALLALNPNDVASISVLRDVSSTAVYGTKAANGVILVQLRKRE